MRQTIAKRLTESKQQIPHYSLTVEVEMDKLLKLREELNSALEEGKLSVNDFVVKVHLNLNSLDSLSVVNCRREISCLS